MTPTEKHLLADSLSQPNSQLVNLNAILEIGGEKKTKKKRYHFFFLFALLCYSFIFQSAEGMKKDTFGKSGQQ